MPQPYERHGSIVMPTKCRKFKLEIVIDEVIRTYGDIASLLLELADNLEAVNDEEPTDKSRKLYKVTVSEVSNVFGYKQAEVGEWEVTEE